MIRRGHRLAHRPLPGGRVPSTGNDRRRGIYQFISGVSQKHHNGFRWPENAGRHV
jgi:hypothetical protein